jgi:hypothetical protein
LQGEIVADRSAFWHTFVMARFGGLGLWCGLMVRGITIVVCALGLAAGWGGGVLRAQDAPTLQDQPIHTLHVYTNLMQIPVLVLSAYRTPMAPIAASKFSVSIDSGPRFRPTHVRLEGDDPISLSILLDARESDEDLLPKIDSAIADLASISLQPHDRVSLFVLDCTLAQSLNGASVGQDAMKGAVDLALQDWMYLRKNRHAPRCKPSVHLWDALTLIVQDTYQIPGRHVILAVTDGSDRGSKASWDQVRVLAQETGVAIFGLTYETVGSGPFQNRSYENDFNSVCELSGGMVLTTTRRDEERTLRKFISMIRGRYIVEFPRSSNSTAGRHDFLVTIDKSAAFIRPAGISVPVADPAVLADPTTIRRDAQGEPVEGTGSRPARPQ